MDDIMKMDTMDRAKITNEAYKRYKIADYMYPINVQNLVLLQASKELHEMGQMNDDEYSKLLIKIINENTQNTDENLYNIIKFSGYNKK